MKTKLFKSFALILATILVLSSLVMTTSAENRKPGLRTEDEAKEYIEKYAHDIDEEDLYYSVVEYQKIESFSGEKSYVVYSLSPLGYAVYDEVSGVVEEMVLGTESPYKNAKDGVLFYGGPMNYFVKSGEAYLSIKDDIVKNDIVLSENDIAELTKLELYTVANRQKTVKGIPQTTEYYYMKSSVYFTSLLGDKFGDNTNGICTQVACGIMLGFYDNYVNTQFVPTAYEDNYGITPEFHTYLQTFIGTSPSECQTRQVV